MNTRDIAEKIYTLRDLLHAERCKANAEWRMLRRDEVAERMAYLEAEIDLLNSMADDLWDMKKNIRSEA